MAAFQNIREQTERKVMVHLLSEIERNPSFTQRSLASELGIALGLMNQYLKRCITRGWLRVSQISPKRITYFLTPEGFKEKSIMVAEYLSRSLTFFRDARSQCEDEFAKCRANNWNKIALVGKGDLADIAELVSYGNGINVEIIDTRATLKNYDAVLITDIIDPQGTYDAIKNNVDPDRLLILKLLHISKGII